jgi:hypothetical protein
MTKKLFRLHARISFGVPPMILYAHFLYALFFPVDGGYARAMSKYGLRRGIDGSDTRWISTQQFYRELFVENEHLKEDNEVLQEQKEATYEKVRDLYDRKDEMRDRFLDMDIHLREKEKELNT